MNAMEFFYMGVGESRIQGSQGQARYKEIIMEELVKHSGELSTDRYGNIIFEIEGSRTIFSAHTDTAHTKDCKILWDLSDNYLFTDGKTALGADNASGVAVLMSLIQDGVPGLYIFHDAEEKGGTGSLGYVFDNEQRLQSYHRCIAFDRKGTDSIITSQFCGDTASYEFADSLARELRRLGMPQYKADDTGVFTDTANYAQIVPECTNISIGYYQEHTYSECQDLRHLEMMLKIAPKINWEDLKTARRIMPDYKAFTVETRRATRKVHKKLKSFQAKPLT